MKYFTKEVRIALVPGSRPFIGIIAVIQYKDSDFFLNNTNFI